MYVIQDIDHRIETWIVHIAKKVDVMLQDVAVETKKHYLDLVTNIDKEVQADFTQLIKANYPEYQIMGEEKSNSEVDMYRGYAWAIDPIDGTTNLVKQGKDYCLIVSLFYDGEPLLAYTYEFYQQKLYKAVQGQGVTINGVPLHVDKYYHLNDALISIDPKRASSELLKALISHAHGFRFIGAGGIGALRTITGDFGASIDMGANLWDMSAQILYAKELGLVVTDIQGNSIDLNHVKGAIIAHPDIHEDIINIIKTYQ
ncbi:inositol monophosphatase family protein [Staphylococcus haemolyticus]|uniref:inositol monophosphatase family protein n=1 Tax=Staphylococcus haemolyticus TaxID=1283 RepID=UPI002ACDD73D|nr:inositol monophosphatase family protein [Staphylococcus haemolyticus]